MPKKNFFIILTLILMGIVIEIGLNISILLLSKSTVPAYLFNSEKIRHEYKKELEHANQAQTFEQYVMYKGTEFKGKYINVNKDGTRQTINSTISRNIPPKEIYMFGGSTMWGYWARDKYTIPSILSNYLHENGHNIKITNYGVIRDSSSIELIRLFLLLKAGKKIDYVIFYDGFNDVASGIRAGFAGRIRQYERYKEVILNNNSGIYQIKNGFKKILSKYSGTYKLLKLLNPKINPFKTNPKKVDKPDQLVNDIVQLYLETINTIDYLSKAYGFKYLCFWQPMAYLESSLTKEEKPRVNAANNIKKKYIIGPKVNKKLKSGMLPHFYNISDVLKNRKKSVYIDAGHLTEKGNEMVSQRIGEILVDNYL